MIRRRKNRTSLAAMLFALCASPAFAAGVITIINNDPPGVGFNDTTPVVPVGGNPSTTLGAQRLTAIQATAAIWRNA
jgi:hypothetical protein